MGWLLLLAPVLASQVHGVNSLDTIIIDRGVDEPIRIAVVPFAIDATTAADATRLRDLANPADIVAFDLARSGQFDPMAKENMLSYPSDRTGVFFRDWRILNTAYLVIGKVSAIGSDSLTMSFELYDVAGRRQLEAREYRIQLEQWRDAAHQIADIIYTEITGVRGA
ncbi:MAG: Tol-Pal system protein TolB, partial [Pseudomonadota bacterium]